MSARSDSLNPAGEPANPESPDKEPPDKEPPDEDPTDKESSDKASTDKEPPRKDSTDKGSTDEGSLGKDSTGEEATGAESTDPEPANEKPTDAKFPTPQKTRVRDWLLMIALLIIVVIIVSTQITWQELVDTIVNGNPVWLLAALVIATLVWLGAALPLVAFAPIRVPLKDAVDVQIASSFAGAVAPSGWAEVAITLRYLVVAGQSMTSAISTLALINIAQVLPSALLVVVALIFAGVSPDITLDVHQLYLVIAAIALVLIVIFVVPPLRRWVLKTVTEVWEKFYPQLLWVLHHPKRLAIGFAGSILQTLSFIGALWASLMAFGGSINFIILGAAFLIANTLGSVLPVPGGVGSKEAALVGTLHVAGVPLEIALSATVAYRLATYYLLMIPGYFGLVHMQAKKLI